MTKMLWVNNRDFRAALTTVPRAAQGLKHWKSTHGMLSWYSTSDPVCRAKALVLSSQRYSLLPDDPDFQLNLERRQRVLKAKQY
jgi:hypothetical protein